MTTTGLIIREATRGADEDVLWDILRDAVESGAVFCADPSGGQAGALAYFWPETARAFVAEIDGTPLGVSYLKPNQTGNGGHVCNAGYCTVPQAAGRGVARALLAHSLETARESGFRAMQYNFVVASNTRAIETWQRAGFDIVGRLPGAFHHPEQGYIDALVMFKTL